MSNAVTHEVLDRALAPVARCLNAESASALLQPAADPLTEARLAELAEKANEGLLTGDETEEYDALILLGDLLAILRAKARLILAAGR